MAQQRIQNFYSLTHISLFASMAEELLKNAQEQLGNLEKAKGRASVLDDALITRIIKAQTEQNDHAGYVMLQCKRWREEPLSAVQAEIIDNIEYKIEKTQQINQQLLALAKHYQQHTIDKILAMDPAALAVEVLRQETETLSTK